MRLKLLIATAVAALAAIVAAPANAHIISCDATASAPLNGYRGAEFTGSAICNFRANILSVRVCAHRYKNGYWENRGCIDRKQYWSRINIQTMYLFCATSLNNRKWRTAVRAWGTHDNVVGLSRWVYHTGYIPCK